MRYLRKDFNYNIMRTLLAILTLLSLNKGYSQADAYNVHLMTQSGSTYQAESFDQSMYYSMQHRKRADENYERIRRLRKELGTMRDAVQINKDTYLPLIDKLDTGLYKIISGNNNLAHPEVDKIIKMTGVFIDEIIKSYNEDVNEYNRKRRNY